MTSSTYSHAPELPLPKEKGPRRLPVYMLLDTSASMNARLTEYLKAFQHVLTCLQDVHDEQACPVFTTFVVFQSEAAQLFPLIPVDHEICSLNRLQNIKVSGTSCMGKAFDLVDRSLEDECSNPGMNDGDAKPLLFLFTDGNVQGRWELRESILKKVQMYVCWEAEQVNKARGFYLDCLDHARFIRFNHGDDQQLAKDYVQNASNQLRKEELRFILWPSSYRYVSGLNS